MAFNFCRMVTKCFTEKVTFEQRPEEDGASHIDIKGNYVLAKGRTV